MFIQLNEITTILLGPANICVLTYQIINVLSIAKSRDVFNRQMYRDFTANNYFDFGSRLAMHNDRWK